MTIVYCVAAFIGGMFVPASFKALFIDGVKKLVGFIKNLKK